MPFEFKMKLMVMNVAGRAISTNISKRGALILPSRDQLPLKKYMFGLISVSLRSRGLPYHMSVCMSLAGNLFKFQRRKNLSI